MKYTAHGDFVSFSLIDFKSVSLNNSRKETKSTVDDFLAEDVFAAKLMEEELHGNEEHR